MAAPADLRLSLSAYDGKSVTILSEIAARHRGDDRFVDDLIALAGDAEELIADASTRLIKMQIDEGETLSPAQTSALVRIMPKIQSWQASLHCCQIVGRLKLSPQQAKTLAPWLKTLLAHERPFLRAWSLDGLCALAGFSKDLHKSAETALAKAANDPAASVRARARNIRLP